MSILGNGLTGYLIDINIREEFYVKAVILKKGDKPFTLLKNLFLSINNIQKEFNWLITEFECYPRNQKYAEMLSGTYCWMTGNELTAMVECEDFQWIWGVFSAFPINFQKEHILEYKFPKADGNTELWQNPISMQHPLAEIEIIAWDSSMTIIICKNDAIIECLKNNNPLAEDLETYL